MVGGLLQRSPSHWRRLPEEGQLAQERKREPQAVRLGLAYQKYLPRRWLGTLAKVKCKCVYGKCRHGESICRRACDDGWKGEYCSLPARLEVLRSRCKRTEAPRRRMIFLTMRQTPSLRPQYSRSIRRSTFASWTLKRRRSLLNLVKAPAHMFNDSVEVGKPLTDQPKRQSQSKAQDETRANVEN